MGFSGSINSAKIVFRNPESNYILNHSGKSLRIGSCPCHLYCRLVTAPPEPPVAIPVTIKVRFYYFKKGSWCVR